MKEKLLPTSHNTSMTDEGDSELIKTLNYKPNIDEDIYAVFINNHKMKKDLPSKLSKILSSISIDSI